jgi:transcriptional pleiotropic regulator of transition state genes
MYNLLYFKGKICKFMEEYFMKATGMVRPVDNLGRVVIPREIRKQFDIENGIDSFEIFVDGDNIVLKKYQPNCIFCSETNDTINYNNHVVCKACVEKLSELTK